jgi:esterase
MAGEVEAALAQHLGGEPAELIGHSLGGRVASQLAATVPERAARLVLLDIAPGRIPPNPEVERLLRVLVAAPARWPDRTRAREHLLGEGLPRALADWLLMNLAPGPGGPMVWRIDRGALAAAHQRLSDQDLWPLLEAGQVRVDLCVRGGASGYVSEPEAARLEEAGARVVTLAGAGPGAR